MNNIEQVFTSCLKSTVGKLFLAVLGVGIALLFVTFLPELIGLIVLGVLLFLGFHYFGTKL